MLSKGSFLPPITADRHGTLVQDRVENRNTARHVHEDSDSMMNEKDESDEETKSQANVTSEDDA